jgi:hypothetical protein
MRNSGIEWVRMGVKRTVFQCEPVFRKAHDLDMKVIAVVTSKNLLGDLGFGRKHYLPGSGWDEKWKERFHSLVEGLNQYVDIWQIDNELNHPWHNPFPWLNKALAFDIVKGGIDAVKDHDSDAKVAVNLFFRRKTKIPGIGFPNDRSLIMKLKNGLGDEIDILGMDIYRETWHKGSPWDYPDDLDKYHEIWGKDIMIMETGYCTGSFGHTNESQANHVNEVFKSLDNHIRNSDWFLGLIWYEYVSRHEGIPCENFFGLHNVDGITEKPAWEKFKENVEHYKHYNKVFGTTYHY